MEQNSDKGAAVVNAPSGMWYQDAVFYHIFTLSAVGAPFINDYRQQAHRAEILEKYIPHLCSLGVNAVLLSPVLKSRSHGYDVTDYFNIDNRFCTNEEFRRLVDRFHAAGIKVVLDSVYNHCGRDFAAFVELCSGKRENAEWFSGINFDGTTPYGDPFDYENWSGHYELVKFHLQSPTVKEYLMNATRFWIRELGIDGMRLDSANVMDFDFMKELRQVVTAEKQDFWLMGEVVHGDYTRWLNDETLHSVTGYMLYKALYSSHNDNNLYELAHTIQSTQPQNGLYNYSFLDNHDQPRIASLVQNPGFLTTLYILLFTLPGHPSVYYGSEWGVKGRKGENVPDGGNGDSPLRPYFDPDQFPEDTEITRLIRQLCAIRGELPALRRGSYRQVYLEYHKPFVFEREAEGQKIIIAVNIADREEFITIDGGMYREHLTGTVVSGESISLQKHSGVILTKERI